MHDVTSRAKLPKLAPDTIRRERIVTWLGDHADVPLRLVAAPTGSGKTTALVTYASAPRHRCGYVTLDVDTSVEELRARLARAFGFARAASADDDALHSAFEEAGRCEVLVDEVDRAPEAVRAALRRFVYEAPDNVTFVYATRSRDVVDATRLVSLGLGAILDADRLAFTAEEATRLAEAARLDADEREIGRLVHDTEGWAFALSSAIRETASAGRSLDGAFDRWRRTNARFMRRYIDDALADEDPVLAAAARKLYDGELIDESILDRLEQRGLFVRWADGTYRPYRAVARVTRAAAPAAPARSLTPFTVHLFGKPDVRMEGQRVAWFRRRDAQIFAFLALQPQGRARRETLLRAFWPEADRQLAAQSLRSACSTMRRSLAAVVGYADLNHYVAFGDEIALNLDLFAIDARRVRAHLRDAEASWSSGDVIAAMEHDRAALKLSRDELLDGDVPAALAGVASEFDESLTRAAARTAAEPDDEGRPHLIAIG